MDKPHDILREYIDKSEKRVVIDGVFYARMSPEIAKNFDAGVYDFMLQEHKKCITELQAMNIKYFAGAKPVFYIYIVPDENFIELLSFPYKERKSGGRPVAAYDFDSFNSAYGTSQNLLTITDHVGSMKHVNLIHEYAHLIEQQFGFREQMFGEGVAETIPWYILEYEKFVPLHVQCLLAMEKIYTANELLTSVSFTDTVPEKTCSFQLSYMSSYLWIRAVVEYIESKFQLSRFNAVQKFLELCGMSRYGKQWFVIELANIIGMDAEKLLSSTEYQRTVLEKIKKEAN